jgi:glycosyltransferase involved in cell wall biosynthesis
VVRHLSIVIPCYNEAENLNTVFSRLDSLHKLYPTIEIVLVDNGSEDETPLIIENHLKGRKHFVKLVRIEKNIGYGHGIMVGARIASGEVIAWTHADLQTDPADVLKAYKMFVIHTDYPNCILKGRRVGRSAIDALFTGGMSILSTLLLKEHLSDINAQPKMFHRDFLEKLIESPNDFSLDLYLLFQARLHGYSILEYPVNFGKRLHGLAKGGGSLKGKWKLIRRTMSYMLKLKHDLGR